MSTRTMQVWGWRQKDGSLMRALGLEPVLLLDEAEAVALSNSEGVAVPVTLSWEVPDATD